MTRRPWHEHGKDIAYSEDVPDALGTKYNEKFLESNNVLYITLRKQPFLALKLGKWPMERDNGRQVFVSIFDMNAWSPSRQEWFDHLIPAIAHIYELIEEFETTGKIVPRKED